MRATFTEVAANAERLAKALRSWESVTATGWAPSAGTTRPTSRRIWRSRPWGRSCTPSTSGCFQSSSRSS